MDIIPHSFTVQESGKCLLIFEMFCDAKPPIGCESCRLLISQRSTLNNDKLALNINSLLLIQEIQASQHPNIIFFKIQKLCEFSQLYCARIWWMPATLCYLQQFCDANLQLIVKLIFSNANSTSWTWKLKIFQHPYTSEWIKDFLPRTHIN